MKSKKTIVSLAVLTLILTAGVVSVSAYQGDYTKSGPNYSPERHEAMEAAFEDNDYGAWKELMDGRGRVSDVINEENFARFAEAHKLAEDGQYNEADAIRAELGLRGRGGERMGAGYRGGHKQGGQSGSMGRGMRGNNSDHVNFTDANNDGICDNMQ